MSDEGRLIAGRYRLIGKIGRGGMGTVWRAEDELLGRQVAVKQLHIPLHMNDDELATLHERTRREARSAARITHRNVVVVHDVVDDNGLPCIVMEYVPSTTLAEVLKTNGRVSHTEAARIGRGMIAALRAAHAAGVLHRDVKPGNVLLGEGGRVVLTDFGIAMATGTSTLTKTGEVVGSIDYIAPERVKGRKPGPASDLWALGATLYQALEGRPPFRRDTAVETAYAIAVDPLEPVRNTGPLTPLVVALLAKDPQDRPDGATVERALRAPASQIETAALPTVLPPPPSATEQAPTPDTTSNPYATRQTASLDPAPTPAARPPAGFGPVEPMGPLPPAGTSPTLMPPAPLTPTAPPSRPQSPSARPRRTRRALWSAVAAVVAVMAIAGGGYLLTRNDGSGTRKESTDAGPKTPDGSSAKKKAETYTPPPVPEGYHLQREEQFDLSLPVPDGWTRQVKSAQEVQYLAPSGLAYVKINVLDFAASDPVQHLEEVEQQLQVNYPVYDRLRLQPTRFRGQPAAIWEFAFQGRERWYRATDLSWGREGGKEYAIYLSAPKVDWDSHKSIFDHVRDGLRLPTDTGSGSGQG